MVLAPIVVFMMGGGNFTQAPEFVRSTSILCQYLQQICNNLQPNFYILQPIILAAIAVLVTEGASYPTLSAWLQICANILQLICNYLQTKF